MALLDKPIEVAFVADDSQISEVMARIGKQSEKMGGTMRTSSEGARLGMWSLGESAENLAQSLGVPNKMSRQLGNSVENLTRSMGSLAVGLGAVGLVAMAGYAIWSHFTEEKKKAREEIDKSVKSLEGEVAQLSGVKTESWGLEQANLKLYAVKSDLLKLEFSKKMKEEREELKRMNEELKAGGTWWEQFKRDFSAATIAGGVAEKAKQLREQDLADYRKNKRLRIAEKDAELNAEKEKNKGIIDDLAVLNAAEMKHYYDADAMRSYFFEQDVKRQQEEERTNQLRIQGAQVVAQNFSSTFQMMASLGGKHARQWFTLYKMSAISEAVISTYAGAARALNDYPAPWSYAVAASVVAAGLAKVAVIRAQQFQGGGATSGAIGTFPVNPATGIQTGQGFGQITININGSTAGTFDINQVMTEGLRTIYNNNGSLGGFAISVERSA